MERLRAALDAVGSGLVAVLHDGEILAANEKACEILGREFVNGSNAGVLLESLRDLADDPQSLLEMVSSYRGDAGDTHECKIQLRANKLGVLQLELTPILVQNVSIGTLWIIRDETRVRTLQSELLQAQKMEAVGSMAGGMAHDFNNLLTGIIGNIELIRMKPESKVGELDDYLEDAESASLKAGEIIRSLMSFNRKTPIQLRTTDPKEVIKQLQPLLRHGFKSSIQFVYELDEALPQVEVDSTQIEQVLLNLCLNARDAMPHGGKISIGVRGATLEGHDAVAFYVRDAGCGMVPEVCGRVFEPFFTTKEVGKGSGLGLATSQLIVKQHHGELTCESEVGRGTEFVVTLPIAATKNRLDGLPDDEIKDGTVFYGDETVLVVDDEWLVRKVAMNIMESGGYESLEARSGEECLSILETQADVIDVVLLDVTLPDRGGFEILEDLHRLHPDLPVVLCSGYAYPGNDYAQDFVAKPFRIPELLRAIRNALDHTGKAGKATQ